LGNNPAIQFRQATTSKGSGSTHSKWELALNQRSDTSANRLADPPTPTNTASFCEQGICRGKISSVLNREVLGHTQRAKAAESETQTIPRALTDVRVRIFFEAIASQQQVDATRAFADLWLRPWRAGLQRMFKRGRRGETL